ncbi:flagellar assembly protein FliH [Cellvibrio zantedeschiae]|uniref:Flagellar assembly protein FliH n=1 Tax=Cellvibrio zantedeschiae TaxID=1237077 RepID=A0ABQ3AUP2_9GAMM|nr:flagellar assembly protein FliH [Cellvibrio zantedeschiae]GGY68373.1 flagellar assembly protein FliH [Cellvibrio zantedeschiae]
MTSKSMPGRIASENLGEVTSWMLPPVDDTGKVLSSAEKEARMRREKLLQQGKEKIETVEIPAQQKTGMTAQEMQEIFDAAEKDGFAQGHAEGLEKGRSDGYEAGRQQGLMEMRAQLTLEQQRFQSIANSLLNPLTAQDNDIENMLLDVICSLTQSVIQRELVTDSSHILELVKTAVEALPVGSKNIRISLNPDDLAVVETYAADQQLDWKFFGDIQLQPGGCRVETPESRVDFSVSQRLQTVLEQFLTGQLAQLDGADDSSQVE